MSTQTATIAAPRRRSTRSRAITAAQWAAMAAELTQPPAHSGAERRSEPRTNKRQIAHIFIKLGGWGKPTLRFLVRTKDISRFGIGFVHCEAAGKGSRCRVSLVANDGKLVEVRGAIASCNKQDDGFFSVGVRFDSPIPLSRFVRSRE